MNIHSRQWRKLRLTILKRDYYTCAYCGGEANAVDHIVPRAKGGTDEPTNLVAACTPCNTRKRDSFFLKPQATHPIPNLHFSPGIPASAVTKLIDPDSSFERPDQLG